MGLRISGQQTAKKGVQEQESVARLDLLSSGVCFSRAATLSQESLPLNSLSAKERELLTYQKNIHAGRELVLHAESKLSEISNIVTRLKGILGQAMSPVWSDKERQFYFVEYRALYQRINHISQTTTYANIALLSAHDEAARARFEFSVGPRVGTDEENPHSEVQDDHKTICLNILDGVDASAQALGLFCVDSFFHSAHGVSLDDVSDLLAVAGESFSEVFEKAARILALFGARFDLLKDRFRQAGDDLNAAFQNLSAAYARMHTVDYATEMTNLTKANILMRAGMNLLTKKNLSEQTVLSLLAALDKPF